MKFTVKEKFVPKHDFAPKHEKETVTDEALSRSVITSVFGILICMACLVGLTWALFADKTVIPASKIQASKFYLEETVKDADGTEPELSENVRVLDPDKTYTVTLSQPANDNTVASKGYYRVIVKQDGASAASVYYTEIISDGAPFSFSLSGFTSISLVPMWGELSENITELYIISNGGQIPPPEVDKKLSSPDTAKITPKNTENEAKETDTQKSEEPAPVDDSETLPPKAEDTEKVSTPEKEEEKQTDVSETEGE